MTSSFRSFLALAVSLSTCLPVLAQTTAVRVPPDVGEDLLEPRRAAQFESIAKADVFSFFQFSDRTEESGVTFRHEATDDGARDYKMVHYDHGNGIAVADVDGDGLLDLYFLTQLGANELWKNLGRGRFENVTEKAGVGLDDRISVGAAFADVDNDGDQDLFVTTVRMGNVLFRNEGDGTFVDISESAGVGLVAHSSGAAFFDYDQDGWLDLVVTNVGRYTSNERGRGGYWVGLADAFTGHLYDDRTEISRLYRNRGDGTFEDVTEKSGLLEKGWNGDVAVADVDADGDPDVYFTNMQGDDGYWVNENGERFVDRTAAVFPKTSWGAMGIAFLDWNNDGLLDLYVTDMHSDMAETIGPEREKLKSDEAMLGGWSDENLEGGANNIWGNSFYAGTEPGRFEEISDRIGVENYWPWGTSAGDLNADGWIDLFVTASMNYQFRYGVDSLFLNESGDRFVDAEFALGVEPRPGSLVAPWFELDCASEEHALCEGREDRLSVYGARGSRSSVLFDLDDDGDLDIVTNEFHTEPRILVSDLDEQADLRFLKIRLEGTSSNRDGLGSIVRVTTGETVQTRVHNGKSGYLAQSSMPEYFGLGSSEKVDAVEVRWPSGIVQTVTEDIPTSGVLTLVEPTAESDSVASEDEAGS